MKRTFWTHPPDRTPLDNDCYVIGCGLDKINTPGISHRLGHEHKINFHILYFLKGGCDININGKNYVVKEQELVFLYTGVEYKYVYHADPETHVYWIHFSGEKSLDLCSELELSECFVKKADQDLSPYFNNIIEEIDKKKKHYNKMMTAYLTVLLTAIVRKKMANQSRFDDVLSRMNDTRKKQLSLDKYAEMCHLSKSQFIRNFKEYTGKTPIKYKNDILIDRAKEKLTHSDISISELSNLLGFENIYYFSTMFKKAMGMSPAEYRKKHK